MKKAIMLFFVMVSSLAVAQTTYDSKTLVDTNNNSTSTSTVNTNNTNNSTSTSTSTSTVNSTSTNNNVNTSTNTNTNYNVNSGTQTINNVNSGTMTYNNNNNNVNASTSTNTNTNNNNNVNTGDMTNRNINSSTSSSTNNNVNQNIQSGELKNINETTIKQIAPPPTAIAPAMMSGGNNDLCTTGTSGAVQTQILGVSSGGTIRDMNCERLKNAKTLYDMGMKVAAVATLCQDRRVFDAMWNAGTPCPYEGMIGEQAKVAWTNNPEKQPKPEEIKGDDFYKKTSFGALLGILAFKLIGL